MNCDVRSDSSLLQDQPRRRSGWSRLIKKAASSQLNTNCVEAPSFWGFYKMNCDVRSDSSLLQDQPRRRSGWSRLIKKAASSQLNTNCVEAPSFWGFYKMNCDVRSDSSLLLICLTHGHMTLNGQINHPSQTCKKSA